MPSFENDFLWDFLYEKSPISSSYSKNLLLKKISYLDFPWKKISFCGPLWKMRPFSFQQKKISSHHLSEEGHLRLTLEGFFPGKYLPLVFYRENPLLTPLSGQCLLRSSSEEEIFYEKNLFINSTYIMHPIDECLHFEVCFSSIL